MCVSWAGKLLHWRTNGEQHFQRLGRHRLVNSLLLLLLLVLMVLLVLLLMVGVVVVGVVLVVHLMVGICLRRHG